MTQVLSNFIQKSHEKFFSNANLLEVPISFPYMTFVIGSTAAGGPIFVPIISIFIGFPSSWTLLYLFTAAIASARRVKTTSAVPWKRCQYA